jgi:hypothetical protein
MSWSAGEIGRALALQTFRDGVIVVPNCYFTGDEADLLVLRPNCKLIDVEIKISRSDLKADIHKDKWWHSTFTHWNAPPVPRTRVEWPRWIWKHYYAMPEEIWKDELVEHMPAKSGILLLRKGKSYYGSPTISVRCHRRVKANPEAKVIDVHHMQKLARLANARMWSAYDEFRRERHESDKERRLTPEAVSAIMSVR